MLVTLDGSASYDPNGDSLTYLWTQTAGPGVTLTGPTTAIARFTSPTNLASDTLLTFRLQVSDAQSTTSDFINITVRASASPPTSSNVAPLASVSASSQNTATGQLAIKAVDGEADGWPGDYTREWAYNVQGAGAWIQLNWSTPYTLDRIVLFDRPNLDDQILSATLSFSDGSLVPVGALNNSGSPVSVSFAPRSVTSLRLTVNTVSSTTINVGLAELEALGYP